MMFDRITGSTRKVLWFAIFGAVGCTTAALVGELWLWLTRTEPQAKPVAICLLLDSSGSMSGNKLTEMQQAACEFIQHQELSKDRLAVVGFDSLARVASPLSQDQQVLLPAIRSLQVNGSTNMADGLRTAMSTLSGAPEDKYILMFTDGHPNSSPDTLREADNCLAQCVRLIAVATGDADASYLATVTKNPELVFPAVVGQFQQAFQKAEMAIVGRQLVESAPTGSGLIVGVLRIGIWTVTLAVGVGLALVAAQNIYLRRAPLTMQEATRAGVGSAAAGFAAGALGQLLFSGTTDAPTMLIVLGRIVGWTLVGLLLGLGIARFVPNLRLLRGLVGGAAGGAVGSLGFLLIGLLVGDAAGRLFGAAIVGLCIGAMIALAEAAFREAWLEVEYGPNETRTVSLGRHPVTIGGDASVSTIYVRGAAPIALRYVFEDGKVYCEDMNVGRSSLIAPNDRRTVGKVAIQLRVAVPVRESSVSDPGSVARRQKVDRPAAKTASRSGDVAATPSLMLPMCLRIRSNQFELRLGTKLRAVDIPGLETTSLEQVVAEVVSSPQDHEVLGLKNLSTTAWKVTMTDGTVNDISLGRTARLAIGARFQFGRTEGVVEQKADMT
jgi:Ca-activated chloride channel family protein